MPPIGNPQDILTTPYGYAGQMAPETAVGEQTLNRRRIIANLLMQNGMQKPQGRMAGRFFVGANPLEYVANLAQTGMGALLTKDIEGKSKDLMTQDRQMVLDAMKGYQDSKKPDQYQSPAESSGMPSLPPQAPPQEPGQTLPPRPDGAYSGQVGAAAMPDEGVQSAQPPAMQPPQPLNADNSERRLGDPSMDQAAPADMGQMVQPPQATPSQPMPSPAPAPTSQPPVRFVEPPAKKTTMDDLAALMTHQHPQVRQYGQFLAQQMLADQEHKRVQSNEDRRFGLDEQRLKATTEETRALREGTEAYRQGTLGTQITGMGINAEHNRALENISKQNADTTASHNKAMEAIQRTQADTQRQQIEQGKTPPGYRRSAGGNLEAIPGGPADTKLQGVFNQDTSMLQNSNASFDRLGAVTNELLTHPGLNGITGVRGKVPDVPGTDAANARALLATLKSQIGFGVLQEMRNNSKTGGALGAVSDAEGKRLENNLAALDTTQGVDQFKKQLQEILSYTEGAKGRLRDTFNMKHKTGEPVPMNPSTGKGPSVGTVDGGYRFKGGDPSKPESWEKVN
jgi:hypothetical protein